MSIGNVRQWWRVTCAKLSLWILIKMRMMMVKVPILMTKVDTCLQVVSRSPALRFLSKSVGVTVPRSVIRLPQIKFQKNVARSNGRSEGIVSSESNKSNSKWQRQMPVFKHSRQLTQEMHLTFSSSQQESHRQRRNWMTPMQAISRKANKSPDRNS